jgi:transcriptional regulator with XRE-family HTH domain
MTKQGGWSPTGFGHRLKRLREERELTQQALAERSGCHAMTVAKLERGVQEPAWPLVLALAKALDVDCKAFEGDPKEIPEPRRGRPRKEVEGKPAPGSKEKPERGKRRKGKGE